MIRKILMAIAAVTCLTNAHGGLFDYNQTSYTADMHINVQNNDGNNNVGVSDIVRTVQRFAYTTNTGQARTALAIQIAQVSAIPFGDGGTERSYFFNAPTGVTTSGVDSISELTGAIGTSLETTGASASADAWALISIAGTKSLSETGFNFTSANFGLTTADWTVDATAGFAGTGSYMEYRGGYVGDIFPGAYRQLNPVDEPNGTTKIAGESADFEQRFGFVYTGINDSNNQYNSGDTLATYTIDNFNSGTVVANVGTTSSNTLYFGTDLNPVGSDYTSSNVVVNFAAPGAVPEPSSLLVFGTFAFGLVAGRRRKK